MILGIIQARVTSSRLPGKVLEPIFGEPMLGRQIDRLMRSKRVNKYVVATSNAHEDDSIETLCTEKKVQVFRGSLNDVLDRVYKAAEAYQPKHVVRLTGDCPLTDPSLIDKIINSHVTSDYDYTSNTITPTYPDGLDVEVICYKALQKAWKLAELPSEREHVTPYIKYSGKFNINDFKSKNDYSYLRWTVDEPEDLLLVRKIYKHLFSENPNFSTEDIIELFSRCPELQNINNMYERDSGYRVSLHNDYERLK